MLAIGVAGCASKLGTCVPVAAPGPLDFSDFDNLLGDLPTVSRILANARDGAGNCVARGYGDGRFGPTDRVSHAQVITFIARAFALDPNTAWATAPPAAGAPTAPAADIGAYIANAGAIPDAPTSQASPARLLASARRPSIWMRSLVPACRIAPAGGQGHDGACDALAFEEAVELGV